MTNKYTIAEKGIKNVEIDINDSKKEGITVMFECNAANEKLKRYLIFHGSVEHIIIDFNSVRNEKCISMKVLDAIVQQNNITWAITEGIYNKLMSM